VPDFENFLTAVACRGEPKRVPQFDGSIYEDHKVRLLDRPIQGLADEVDFWMEAGYDYVPITLGLRQTIRGERGGMMGAKQVESAVLRPAEAQYDPFAEGKTKRLWAEEGSGLIPDQRSFDDFPWPDPDAYDYAALDELGRLLPDGAKAVVNVGYVFMASWMLMGLENFLIALASGERLVERVIRRVGEIQYRVAENVLEFDSVGAVRMPDDMAHTGGTPEDVEKEVKLRIRAIAPGGGYCCGSSNSVPEYVPYENFLAMIGAIQRYGGYPIDVGG